jgi:hypothetical protein
MKYCDIYYWGGRQEQELIIEMREREETDSEIVATDADAEKE